MILANWKRKNVMKEKELYVVLMILGLLLTSCLGDTNTRITMGVQEAVYRSLSSGGFLVSDGRFLYGSNLGVTADDGDCFLIEYSFDAADSELKGSDSLSIEMEAQPVEVSLWHSDEELTDTLAVLDGEVLTKSLLGRKAYIAGRLFLWSNHSEVSGQQDSFMISYDPANMYTEEDGKRIYTLYLRAVKKASESDEESTSTETVLRTNAFDIEEFFLGAKERETARGETELNLAIRYVSAYNKDTTECVWSTADLMTVAIGGDAE